MGDSGVVSSPPPVRARADGPPATYARGVRRPYRLLPSSVRRWVETQLGEEVSAVRDAVGGFSPGTAATVTGSTGRELFVKAVDGALNAESLRLYQVEREVTARLPRAAGICLPSGAVDLEVDGQTYAVLVFPAVDGTTPPHPWDPATSLRVLDALADLRDALTPSPWPPSADDARLVRFFERWSHIAECPDDPWRDDPWISPRLDRILAAEEVLRAEIPGTTLSHTDLRADNVVVTAERVWFVDWAHARNAAPWLDAALLISDVIASGSDRGDGGDLDVAALVRSHRAFADTDWQVVWRCLLGLAGALHHQSRQPAVPGLPTIRDWQGLTAQAVLRWCVREAPSTF